MKSSKITELSEKFSILQTVLLEISNCRLKLKKTIEQISAESSFEADGMSTKSIAKDMVDMYKKSGFTFKEYILYDFAHLSMTERMKYVADWEHLGYTGTLNNYGNISLFDDQWCTYQKYRKFYNREMILFTDDENAVIAFIEHNPSFCCKPYNSSAGRGVKIVDSGEANDKINLFRELQKEYSGKFILEQLIEQHEDIKKLHLSSVNTMRITTIRMDDKILLIHPRLRVGQNGNNVDNLGSGGIECIVDPDTGIVTVAADKQNHICEKHPTTGEQLVGYKVPYWDEAVKFANELAEFTPETRYVGWDLALNEKGKWVLVEANRRGQFGWQVATKVGFREEIDSILKDLKLHY